MSLKLSDSFMRIKYESGMVKGSFSFNSRHICPETGRMNWFYQWIPSALEQYKNIDKA